MRLWTIQPYCVYELIQANGIYRCDSSLSELLDSYEFINAYEWISKQMKNRIGNPPDGIKYPVWAWYSVNGKHQRPDMRTTDMRVFKKSALMEIEISDIEVLLTDFDNWHLVLNNSIYHKANDIPNISFEEWEAEAEKEDTYFDSLSDEEKISYKETSWENIICSENKPFPKYVQATFWELKKDQIKKVWILKK